MQPFTGNDLDLDLTAAAIFQQTTANACKPIITTTYNVIETQVIQDGTTRDLAATHGRIIRDLRKEVRRLRADLEKAEKPVEVQIAVQCPCNKKVEEDKETASEKWEDATTDVGLRRRSYRQRGMERRETQASGRKWCLIYCAYGGGHTMRRSSISSALSAEVEYIIDLRGEARRGEAKR